MVVDANAENRITYLVRSLKLVARNSLAASVNG